MQNEQSSYSYLTHVKIALHYLIPQLALTQFAGWLAERKWGTITHFMIKLFAKKYCIDLSEAEKIHVEEYETFNQFFIRKLKSDARPIDPNKNSICFPADGRISELGKISSDKLIQAKGHYFDLNTLLANEQTLVDYFKDGNFITTYLSPQNYHRVHMPCQGQLRKMIYVPGKLFSVNPFLAQYIPHLFAKNERVICVFDTPFGTMVQILVGATITASISTVWAGVINPPRSKEVVVCDYPTTGENVIQLEKGQEMGAFRLGSTVINLFPPNSIEFEPLLSKDSPTKVGEPLATRI